MRRTTLIVTHLLVLLTGIGIASTDVTPDPTFTGARSASAPIVAVSQTGEGTIGQVTVRIRPGTGKVLLDTNPFIETSTQISATTARNVAEEVTGVSLRDKDVIYTFSISGTYLGGPSAGAAMTAATIAAIRNASIRRDIAITGSIRPDGRIGRVGGVVEKAMTAGEHGMETFLVPAGQSHITFYRRVIERERVAPGFLYRDTRYEPIRIRLNNLTRRRYGMGTRSVATIQEALPTLLTDTR